MPTDHIRYDLLVQEALKGVVRNVLAEAAREGLPGDHHFCITFKTNAPGVKLSARVREKHPDELTIILQHQFWDLVVTEPCFEVGLSFGHVPERLIVPFEALTGFWDPSVQFGLKFEVQEPAPQSGANDAAPEPLVRDNGNGAADEMDADEAGDQPPPSRGGKSSGKGSPAPKPTEQGASAAAAKDEKVVSIDAFRKKP